ncbi:hypothetical protein SeLEV6574_g08656 [Synchytrium endobioticum]|uniref:Uncharacterized protein n=1 Tax=Synchytrium endobioticum TaxID=286115 RepID=A0A507BFW4_9FUNG|nr:hypothetical protein SeLEV6574_g08656 [Synchytrium endobioticum]
MCPVLLVRMETENEPRLILTHYHNHWIVLPAMMKSNVFTGINNVLPAMMESNVSSGINNGSYSFIKRD